MLNTPRPPPFQLAACSTYTTWPRPDPLCELGEVGTPFDPTRCVPITCDSPKFLVSFYGRSFSNVLRTNHNHKSQNPSHQPCESMSAPPSARTEKKKRVVVLSLQFFFSSWFPFWSVEELNDEKMTRLVKVTRTQNGAY